MLAEEDTKSHKKNVVGTAKVDVKVRAKASTPQTKRPPIEAYDKNLQASLPFQVMHKLDTSARTQKIKRNEKSTYPPVVIQVGTPCDYLTVFCRSVSKL